MTIMAMSENIGMWGLRGLAAIIGLYIVIGTLISAIKTFVLPRGVNVWLTRIVFWVVGFFFRVRAKKARTYDEQDRIMALFAPVGLLVMPVVLLTLILIGYMFLFWAIDPQPVADAMRYSGSSLLTLGYASGGTIPYKLLEFSEAMIGLILVALLIAYLPTIYAAFSRRETAVSLLENRASSPPSAAQFVSRSYRTGELETLNEVWSDWQIWFAELRESHTSLAPLSFFRSPQIGVSWVTAAGTVLDSAALILSAVDVPPEPRAAFCIRGGYLALRDVAAFFNLSFDANPQAGDPISISREEFAAVVAELTAEGVPIVADLDQAWRDFAGWRVNYDTVLLKLAAITLSPYAPWSSDRSAVVPGKRNLRG
ncbi:MAG: hypothetical protein WBO48_03935 [Candidatus Promineifilaceae bacterium]